MEDEKQKVSKLKTYLITGLVVIIPIWLTYLVVAIVFKWVSGFTFPVVKYYIVDKYWVVVIAKTLSFFASILSILLLGFVANRILGKRILIYIENFIDKLPVLGTVYSSAKKFMSFLFGADSKKSFKQVVFVCYPKKGVYSVAFLTGEQNIGDRKYLCVFMPTTPNPTTGFLLLCQEEDIIYTNYRIEKAFQFIISAGVISMDEVLSKKTKRVI
ncbi:MAG: DUF502 domain-containing protein [Endomicrobium sp.]|jgi:uncharacterized membrane protein|uniref:DUF502 domain-containing protein n=1 Tax=Candidatus Endomicrobiellum cubanum TaxID=3242325 RepID=UPI0028198336|nr:DUF502 domain-containing protein [Endomicrobium sp.]